MAKHKHYDMILKWAEGAEIQFRFEFDEDSPWKSVVDPNWLDCFEYRVKPEPEPEPEKYFKVEQVGFFVAKDFRDAARKMYECNISGTFTTFIVTDQSPGPLRIATIDLQDELDAETEARFGGVVNIPKELTCLNMKTN